MNFNYQKAYCVSAVPAFNSLNKKQKNAFNKLHSLIGDRQQNHALNIPTCKKTDNVLKGLSCLEISELSRASYFTGHWHPSYLDRPFDNKRGESWKISNVCDQELRKRLLPCRTLQIHEGKLRVTFSSKHCWTWEEFSLATKENIKLFKDCNLSFGESTLDKSAKSLSILCGDLWPAVETLPPNELYVSYLEKQKATKLENEKKKTQKGFQI
ncbi:unnamed protein product [marine sediment metagenome]|uniref:Uncharacterized protein n=1 Tax=marine sediment metagenome TaxID=412755 RepID=X1C2A2_9ZZZZ